MKPEVEESPEPELEVDPRGAAAFEAVVDVLMAMEDAPKRLPVYTFGAVLGEFLAALGVIRERQHIIERHLKSEDATVIREDLEGLATLALALVWLEHQNANPDGSTPQALAIAEGRELRRAGMHALGLLEWIGAVTSDLAEDIRAGRGTVDMAEDLKRLAPLLEDHWTLLEPLQTHQAPALRLTLDGVRLMEPLGQLLLEEEEDALTRSDWYELMCRGFGMLEERWDRLRLVAAASYALSGELRWARKGHASVAAMYEAHMRLQGGE